MRAAPKRKTSIRDGHSSRELQKAIAADDKAWLAAHLHFPVRYFGEDGANHPQQGVVPQALRDGHRTGAEGAVLAQDPEKYFENYQGLMVGEGSRNIWFEDFGDVGAGKGVHFEIITINNSG